MKKDGDGIHEPPASVSLDSKETEGSRKPIKNNNNRLSKMKEDGIHEPPASVSLDKQRNRTANKQ
ncbi:MULTISPECIES: hypothetical protein [unclassified Arenibacter]|jgi:hypothetical protein|uniref:hypothetical protein n=1 Tax=unclassified Arenibacter TaxID=2615047 RepID=UPI0011C12477|nr:MULTISPECIES: hypothetical protein [unclassified Arenibacter]